MKTVIVGSKINFKKIKKILDKHLEMLEIKKEGKKNIKKSCLKRTKAVAITGYTVSGEDSLDMRIKNFRKINGKKKPGYTLYKVQSQLAEEVYEFEFKTWKEAKDYIDRLYFSTELFA